MENIDIKVSQSESVAKSRKHENEAAIAAMDEASKEEDTSDKDTYSKLAAIA